MEVLKRVREQGLLKGVELFTLQKVCKSGVVSLFYLVLNLWLLVPYYKPRCFFIFDIYLHHEIWMIEGAVSFFHYLRAFCAESM